MDEVLVLLQKWSCIFTYHNLDLYLTNQAMHLMKLKDDTPITRPPMMFEEVLWSLEKMETLGAIQRYQCPIPPK